MWSVTIIGLGLLIHSSYDLYSTDLIRNSGWLPLILVTLGFSYFGTVRIPGVKASVSVSDTLVFISALLFGIHPAVIISGVDAGIQSIKLTKKLMTRAYNVAAMALSVFVSSSIADYFFPDVLGSISRDIQAAQLILPLAVLALLHYLTNSFLIAAVIAVRRQLNLIKTWRESFLWTSISYLAGAIAAGVVCYLVKFVNPIYIVVIAPVFFIVYFTYKVYLDKVESSNKHLAELSSLYDQVSHAKVEWESTFNAMSDAILIFDCERRLNRINDAGLALEKSLGVEDLLRRTCCELSITCDEGLCRVKRVIETGEKCLEELDRYNGSFMLTADPLINEHGQLQGAVFILKDITEQKRLREQLVQSEKMSAVGQLVSGVAHELNNPLTSVIGYSELVQSDSLIRAETRKHLDIVVNESKRARRIVQNLLTFARQYKPEKNLNDINSILERTVELRAYEMRVHSITVEMDLEELPQTLCDGPQLQQVFLNIIINAEQAMLESHGRGHMKIKSQRNRDQIVITIEDDGPGIPPENLNKIFDPFFTTKTVGKGTGLGLSICYGIVQEHGGKIYPRSRAGEGTTFFIELPIITQAQEQEEVRPVVEETEIPSKQILVVDDEEFIAEIVRGVLEQRGHKVVTANSGKAALELLDYGKYDLILTDIKMPELTGDMLYERVRQADEKLARRMIFMTGDTVNNETREFIQKTGNKFIPKPFALDELLNSVNSAITSQAA